MTKEEGCNYFLGVKYYERWGGLDRGEEEGGDYFFFFSLVFLMFVARYGKKHCLVQF